MLKKEIPKDSEIDNSKIKIIHKMADGTVRDTINGYEIPFNEETAITYQLLSKWSAENHIKDDTENPQDI